MSGLLHPVGPEPAQSYWARRALVFGAAAMVLVIAVALIISGASNGSTALSNPSVGAHSVGSPTMSMRPAKLQANRKPKSLDTVMVPESGPGTFQAAERTVRSRSSHQWSSLYCCSVVSHVLLGNRRGEG